MLAVEQFAITMNAISTLGGTLVLMGAATEDLVLSEGATTRSVFGSAFHAQKGAVGAGVFGSLLEPGADGDIKVRALLPWLFVFFLRLLMRRVQQLNRMEPLTGESAVVEGGLGRLEIVGMAGADAGRDAEWRKFLLWKLQHPLRCLDYGRCCGGPTVVVTSGSGPQAPQ
ncbi:hypothetical protein FIBSPDRAFT_433544 [Athelia psychrophila]|uniref:Uncharacterized protein n=1 Tax=Athelia psychrophila TaxID=1759441 RepID=A0A166VJ78_9AGAM|nr:hypothetical protein FIBSPDRAFT_433544 [Fibularhizoctonia sp. CBS 109695]